MPPRSEKQRRFMAADLGRAKKGQATKTGMNPNQLEDYVHEPVRKGPTVKRKKGY